MFFVLGFIFQWFRPQFWNPKGVSKWSPEPSKSGPRIGTENRWKQLQLIEILYNISLSWFTDGFRDTSESYSAYVFLHFTGIWVQPYSNLGSTLQISRPNFTGIWAQLYRNLDPTLQESGPVKLARIPMKIARIPIKVGQNTYKVSQNSCRSWPECL